MRALKRGWRRLGAWANGNDAEARLLAEIEDHLARQTADYVRAGMPVAEARRQAVLKFGGVEATRERWREQRGVPFLDSLTQDVRHALRRLRLAPAFTITTVMILALGIGATTAIFTLVHAVLLKSLPVSEPGELYRLGRTSRCCYWGGYSQQDGFSLVSYDLYTHLRDGTPGFAELAAFSAGQGPLGVRRAGKAEQGESYPGEFVSGNYFAMFGIPAHAGRTLAPADDRPGAPLVAVMSYRLWMQRFGGDPSLVGSVVNLNDKPFTVVGITPPGFFGATLRSTPPDFFLPLNTEPVITIDPALTHDETHWLALIGRIRTEVSPASVEARMRLELTRWLRSHWGEMSANDRAKLPEQTLFLAPGGAGITSMREEYQHWLEILMLVTGCALLIVCANVATLMLVRGMERRRQTSLAIALGARRARVVREPLIESLLLSFAGGAAGLAIAFAGTSVILQVVFPSIPGVGGVPIDAWPSVPVLLFAAVMSIATGLAFGMVPAWMATRVDPMEALRGANRSTARSGSLPRTTLTVLQAALSLVLLSAAGLLTAAVHRLENQPLGFDQDSRFVVEFNARLGAYQPDQLTPLYQRIHDALSQVPGVAGVALCIYSPFGNNSWGTGIWVDGHAAPGPGDDNYSAWNRVTAGYFDIIGTPIIQGRGISDAGYGDLPQRCRHQRSVCPQVFQGRGSDRKVLRPARRSDRNAHIKSLAWPETRAISTTISTNRLIRSSSCPKRSTMFGTATPPTDANPGSHYLRDIVIAVRPEAQLSITAVRDAMASVDPTLPIHSVRPLQRAGDQRIRPATAHRSPHVIFRRALAGAGVNRPLRRDRVQCRPPHSEIGVRVALGATRGQVMWLVFRGAVVPGAAGVGHVDCR